jgi:hypothetical protein
MVRKVSIIELIAIIVMHVSAPLLWQAI